MSIGEVNGSVMGDGQQYFHPKYCELVTIQQLFGHSYGISLTVLIGLSTQAISTQR